MKKTKLIVVLFFAIFTLYTIPSVYAQDGSGINAQEESELYAQEESEPDPLQERDGADPPPSAPINMALPLLAIVGIGLGYKVVKKV